MRQTTRGTAYAAANVKDMHVRSKTGKSYQLSRRGLAADMKFIHWLKIIKADVRQFLANRTIPFPSQITVEVWLATSGYSS